MDLQWPIEGSTSQQLSWDSTFIAVPGDDFGLSHQHVAPVVFLMANAKPKLSSLTRKMMKMKFKKNHSWKDRKSETLQPIAIFLVVIKVLHCQCKAVCDLG